MHPKQHHMWSRHFIARNMAVLVCLMVLAACTSSHTVTKALQWNPGQVPGFSVHDISASDTDFTPLQARSFKASLENHLAAHEILAQGGVGTPSDYLVDVTVKNYYMRGTGTRFFAGVLAGRDNITSQVKVIHAGSGSVLADAEVVSSNFTAIGGSDTVLDMHAKEVVAFLLGGEQKERLGTVKAQ